MEECVEIISMMLRASHLWGERKRKGSKGWGAEERRWMRGAEDVVPSVRSAASCRSGDHDLDDDVSVVVHPALEELERVADLL